MLQRNVRNVKNVAKDFLTAITLLEPRFPGNRLTQKDNADSRVQFITPAGPRQSLLLAKDPVQLL